MDLSLPLHMWKNEWPFPVIAQVNGYSMKLKTATRYTNGKIFGVDGATDISEYVRRDNNSSNKVVIFRPSTSSDASNNNVKVEYLFFAQPVSGCLGGKTCINVDRLIFIPMEISLTAFLPIVGRGFFKEFDRWEMFLLQRLPVLPILNGFDCIF